MSIRQIAKKSGFSPATVSMALRDSPKISKLTKRQVRLCAQQLNYHPDASVGKLMAQLRSNPKRQSEACFAVISFHNRLRPWERSRHMTRIYEGMVSRASALGYRLEPLFLRSPGMNPRRFRSILDTRGIEGLLCFGSPDPAEEIPVEFDHYAIVTVGASIKTPLHRVTSHMFSDMTQALNQVYLYGYRRPGLVLGFNTDIFSQHNFLSAYLGWCEYRLDAVGAVPVLRLQGLETELLARWLSRYRPDSLVFAHTSVSPKQFMAVLREQRLKVPDDIGVAVVHQILEDTGISGIQQNQAVMGTRAVELLVDRIVNGDLGIPVTPRIELVEGLWIDGESLAKRPAIFKTH